MKKIIYLILLGFAVLYLNSCEENKMVDYGEGGEINFMGDFYSGQKKNPYWVDEVKYLKYEKNFGINPLGDSLMYDTVRLAVKIMGVRADHPRRVVLATNPPRENALEVILADEYYVLADTGIAEIKVVIKRPATHKGTWSTKLIFDYARSDFRAGTLERQEFELKAQDSVSLKLWGTTQEEWDAELSGGFFFGEYSDTKARFIMTLLGCTKFNEWYDSDEFWEVIYGNVLFEALEEYKSDPANPPLLDDRGEWIEFPDIFELM